MSDRDQPNEPEKRPHEPLPHMPPMPSWPEEGSATSRGLPTQLQRAILLMYAGAVLTLLSLPFAFGERGSMRETMESQFSQSDQQLSGDQLDALVNMYVALVIILGLITAGLWLLMATLIKRGKNWARIAGTVLGAAFILFTLMNLSGTVQTGSTAFTLQGVISLATMAVAALALFFLWTTPVREWFEQRRGPMR